MISLYGWRRCSLPLPRLRQSTMRESVSERPGGPGGRRWVNVGHAYRAPAAATERPPGGRCRTAAGASDRARRSRPSSRGQCSTAPGANVVGNAPDRPASRVEWVVTDGKSSRTEGERREGVDARALDYNRHNCGGGARRSAQLGVERAQRAARKHRVDDHQPRGGGRHASKANSR